MSNQIQNVARTLLSALEKIPSAKKGCGILRNRLETTPKGRGPFTDTGKAIAQRIDHTILKPETTPSDIDRVCDEAIKYRFATVCVNGTHVAQVAKRLKGSDVKPISVAGFPLGAGTTEAKVAEAKDAVGNGAREIDMVMNVGALKAKDYALAFEDIRRVVEASAPYPVKVIIETCLLNDDEKIAACLLTKAAGAAFVKTSTGFNTKGATVEDVKLMRETVGDDTQVKASGGIRTRDDAIAMLRAGADRVGASASVSIAEGKDAKGGGY